MLKSSHSNTYLIAQVGPHDVADIVTLAVVYHQTAELLVDGSIWAGVVGVGGGGTPSSEVVTQPNLSGRRRSICGICGIDLAGQFPDGVFESLQPINKRGPPFGSAPAGGVRAIQLEAETVGARLLAIAFDFALTTKDTTA